MVGSLNVLKQRKFSYLCFQSMNSLTSKLKQRRNSSVRLRKKKCWILMTWMYYEKTWLIVIYSCIYYLHLLVLTLTMYCWWSFQPNEVIFIVGTFSDKGLLWTRQLRETRQSKSASGDIGCRSDSVEKLAEYLSKGVCSVYRLQKYTYILTM